MIQKRIEWVDHSLNLWWGCSAVNDSCINCTAVDFSKRLLKEDIFTDEAPRRIIKNFLSDLKQIERAGKRSGIKKIVHIGTMMDIFEESKPLIDGNTGKRMYKDLLQSVEITTGTLRDELFQSIESGKYNNVIFIFQTKRPERINRSIPKEWKSKLPENVWIGTSVSDQKTATQMVSKLVKALPEDANRFLSVEPQLSEINIEGIKGIEYIKWITNSGETGTNARPYQLEWAYKIQKSCISLSIKYFFKYSNKKVKDPKDLLKERVN